MTTTTKEYRRLPGRARTVMGSIRLWQGKDHILLCSSTSFGEDYRRFYYSDIQVITVRKTVTREVRSIFLVALAGMFGLIGFQFGGWARDFWSILAGISLFVSVVDWLRGPTCVCHLRTAIQTVQLSSLNRLRTTRKTIERLKPLIDQSQGTLTAEEIPGKMAALEEAASSLSKVRPSMSIAALPPRHYHGRAHLVLFWLSLADAPHSYLSVFHPGRWETILGGVGLVATIVSLIVALVKQRGSDMPSALKNLPWLILGSLVTFSFVSIGYGLFLAVRNPGIESKLTPLEDPVVLALTWLSTIISVGLGFAGLFLLKKFRARASQPSTPPSNMPVEIIPKS